MTPERWRQVEEIFHAALSRAERERMAFLIQTCADDLVLRREVEALLAQQASAGGLLDDPAVAIAARMVSDIGPSGLIGKRIDTYQVQARIGAGGMGEVYRAFDTKLHRAVAIKLLFNFNELADSTRRRRFQQEAQMASSLNHPHILTVHDIGDLDGRQYLVTELVDGGTLQEWADARQADVAADRGMLVRRGRRPRRVPTRRGLCTGTSSPRTFWSPRTVTRSWPILVWPSSSRALDERATRTVTAARTLPGVIVGTVAYMSPDKHPDKPVDARSDIFSFGVVLYDCSQGGDRLMARRTWSGCRR